MVPVLLDIAAGHGFTPGIAVLDRGYDTESAVAARAPPPQHLGGHVLTQL